MWQLDDENLTQLEMAIGPIQIMASLSSFAVSCQAIHCCSDAKTLEKYGSFPKTTMKVLCSIQLFIAILAIIMGAISLYLIRYGGFWGIVFFGLCGITGI